jgi:hypothetical protein
LSVCSGKVRTWLLVALVGAIEIILMPYETFTTTLLFIDVVIVLGILAVNYREDYGQKRLPRTFSTQAVRYAFASTVLLFFSEVLGLNNPFLDVTKVTEDADVLFGFGALVFLLSVGELYYMTRYRIDESYRPPIRTGRLFVFAATVWMVLINLSQASVTGFLTFYQSPWPYPAVEVSVIMSFGAMIPVTTKYTEKFTTTWLFLFCVMIAPFFVIKTLTGGL